MSNDSYENQQKKDRYKKKLRKWFKSIGDDYENSLKMRYNSIDEGIISVEPPNDDPDKNIFTSLNFVIKVLGITPKYYLELLNKKQAILFIRVIEQYLLRTRNINIEFLEPDNLPEEYKQINIQNYESHLTQDCLKLKEDLFITDKEISDTEGSFVSSPLWQGNVQENEVNQALTSKLREEQELVIYLNDLTMEMRIMDDNDVEFTEDKIKRFKLKFDDKLKRDATARAQVEELIKKITKKAEGDIKNFYKKQQNKTHLLYVRYPYERYRSQWLEDFKIKLSTIRPPIYFYTTNRAKVTIDNMVAHRLRHANNETYRIINAKLKSLPFGERINLKRYIEREKIKKRPIKNILQNFEGNKLNALMQTNSIFSRKIRPPPEQRVRINQQKLIPPNVPYTRAIKPPPAPRPKPGVNLVPKQKAFIPGMKLPNVATNNTRRARLSNEQKLNTRRRIPPPAVRPRAIIPPVINPIINQDPLQTPGLVPVVNNSTKKRVIKPRVAQRSVKAMPANAPKNAMPKNAMPKRVKPPAPTPKKAKRLVKNNKLPNANLPLANTKPPLGNAKPTATVKKITPRRATRVKAT